MVARILAVEDDPIQAKTLAALLRGSYQVATVATGEECLAAAREGAFDLVLLDVVLPGISGYQVCRELKGRPETADLPVIFLSANAGLEDRLQGFEAGGFDYLGKPVVKDELVRKIDLLLDHLAERRSLKEAADLAASAAMTAMTSAAEQGLVLDFMRRSFACVDARSLAMGIVAAARRFGLASMAQVRSAQGAVSWSDEGPCTPLEASVLASVARGGRIVDLGNRTAINFDRASVILKNMPVEEAERYGRLKDHMAMLLEGADARALALAFDPRPAGEPAPVRETLRAAGAALGEVARRNRALHAAYGQVFDRLAHDLAVTMPLLELNRSQEKMLGEMLNQAAATCAKLAGDDAETGRMLAAVEEALRRLAEGQAGAGRPPQETAPRS
ncbi:MAG: response regulator [Rhodocyclaceae bacterium]|nr:response regulator [Rhodocyclaceae bacterium]